MSTPAKVFLPNDLNENQKIFQKELITDIANSVTGGGLDEVFARITARTKTMQQEIGAQYSGFGGILSKKLNISVTPMTSKYKS